MCVACLKDKWCIINVCIAFPDVVFLRILSSSFQHVNLNFPKVLQKPAVRPESGFWVEGAAPSQDRTELNWDRWILLRYLYVSEHLVLFWGVRILVLLHYYWVKDWTGLLPWPAAKAGDVWLLCLCWPLQPSAFLKDWTKLLKIHTGAPEWFYYVFEWWDLSFDSECWKSFKIPYVTLICSALLSYISVRLAPEWGQPSL